MGFEALRGALPLFFAVGVAGMFAVVEVSRPPASLGLDGAKARAAVALRLTA